MREVHVVQGIAQLAVASFSNGAVYRNEFLGVARGFPLVDIFDFDGTAAGARLGAGLGLTYDQFAANPHERLWKDHARAKVFHLPDPRWDNIRPQHDDDAHHYIAKYMLLHALMRSHFPV